MQVRFFGLATRQNRLAQTQTLMLVMELGVMALGDLLYDNTAQIPLAEIVRLLVNTASGMR